MDLNIMILLFCYGLCFGIANKIAFLHEKNDLLDQLLSCPYCLGFHSGWLVWIVVYVMNGTPTMSWSSMIASILMFAFSSSAFCYLADTLGQWLERKE